MQSFKEIFRIIKQEKEENSRSNSFFAHNIQ